MGTIAAITGAIGGLCAAIGIITIMEVIPPIAPQLVWSFWFGLAVILLLGTIAMAIGRGGYD
ncbi:MAG: hypothetical protein HYX91_01575 [Chloroflexi bacterium]|nr:hypothetical protein [Chloroflexota bacterium]